MRRSIAILLFLLMLAALVAPAALATATNPLPACCRAGGRHHCAMMAALMAPGGVWIKGRPCPYRKRLACPCCAAPPPATETLVPAGEQPFLVENHPASFIAHGEQPHPERAPPQPSSLK
jgi:hypothetical protein